MPSEPVWFRNDGGPLCVVPRDPAPLWEGSDPPSGGRFIEADTRVSGTDVATDYDRACDFRAATLLPAGDSWVLVLPGAEDAAAWLPSALDDAASLVFCFGRPQDSCTDTLLALRDTQPSGAWRLVADDIRIGTAGVVLMHAASTLNDVTVKTTVDPADFVGIGDAIAYGLAPGRYRLVACHVDMPEELADATFVTFERLA
jgi:hypothetical protein